MQPSSKILLRVIAVLIVALVAYFLLRPSSLSNSQQIEAQLDAARDAGSRRDASGVLQVVSATYKDSAGLNTEQLALYLRRALGRGERVQVALSPPHIVVTGDTATSVSTVTVRPTDGGQALYDAPVTFHWAREDGVRFLIVPTKVWRITGADYNAALPGADF